uniref:Secreted protein n=1 Tax=Ascaris lumbricoides TaxID=6252 RepID=A0A0M3IH55_ASCLU
MPVVMMLTWRLMKLMYCNCKLVRVSFPLDRVFEILEVATVLQKCKLEHSKPHDVSVDADVLRRRPVIVLILPDARDGLCLSDELDIDGVPAGVGGDFVWM